MEIGVMDRSIFNPTKLFVEECQRRFGADDPTVKMITRIYDKQNLTVPLAMVSLPPGKSPEDYGWKLVTKDGEDYAVRVAPRVMIPPMVLAELGDGDMAKGEDILKKLTFVGHQFYPADDPAPATGPTKPYNEAVNDVHRYLKEVVEKLPESQVDGSVKEGVQDDLGKAIEKRKAQKSWPSALGG